MLGMDHELLENVEASSEDYFVEAADSMKLFGVFLDASLLKKSDTLDQSYGVQLESKGMFGLTSFYGLIRLLTFEMPIKFSIFGL